MKTGDKGPVITRPPGAKCPIPIGKDTNISQIAESCLETVAQDEYAGDDPRFLGKTKLEAAVLSLADDAAHDPQARTEFLDRVMGKPRQRVDSNNVNITLSGFLEQIAEEDSAIDAEFSYPKHDDAEEMFK
jgi:hypothetical protein